MRRSWVRIPAGSQSPGGEIGRRTILRGWRPNGHRSSSLLLGTLHTPFQNIVESQITSNLTFFNAKNDSVAQLVEHLTFNEEVLGSNPSGITEGKVTNFRLPFFVYCIFFFLYPCLSNFCNILSIKDLTYFP